MVSTILKEARNLAPLITMLYSFFLIIQSVIDMVRKYEEEQSKDFAFQIFVISVSIVIFLLNVLLVIYWK